jgi:hypothetical protein
VVVKKCKYERSNGNLELLRDLTLELKSLTPAGRKYLSTLEKIRSIVNTNDSPESLLVMVRAEVDEALANVG